MDCRRSDAINLIEEVRSSRHLVYVTDGEIKPLLLPDSENISAVLANPSGTLPKFNRMGFLAGFGDRDIRMMRRGFCYKGSLVPETFVAEVHASGYAETPALHRPKRRTRSSVSASPLQSWKRCWRRNGALHARHRRQKKAL